MYYRNGDRVRITAKNSMHTGKEGVITNAYGDEQSLLVRMVEKGNQVGFFIHEVEPIWDDEQQKQIERVAAALKNDVRNHHWDWDTALSIAADLYKAGVTRADEQH